MGKSLQDKVVVVTGAGQGIGRGIAQLCAAEGASVVVNDIANGPDGSTVSLAEEVVALIRKAGGEAVASLDNIADAESAARIVQAALDSFGRVDCVINNAGILRDRMFYNMSHAEWRDVITVHLDGYFNVSRAAVSHFVEQKSGSFIHFSSGSGLLGNVGQANYAAAKMGVVGLSTGLAMDLQRHGIRSNVVAPWAWSQLLESIPVRSPEQSVAREHSRQHMRAEQIAPMCAYLASDLSADISGQVFGVRGNEIYLFSQPEILRSAHNAEGWSVDSIAKRAMPSMRTAFRAPRKLTDVVNWPAM